MNPRLAREEHNQEPQPTTHNTHSRVATHEHQWQELQLLTPNNPMQQAAIRDEWYADSYIHQTEAIQQEESRLVTRRRQSIERKQEDYKPEDSVYSLNRELRSREKEREQRDMTCYGERAEGP